MKLAPTYISKETPNGRNSNKGSYTSEWKMLRCTPWGSAKESQGFWSTTICWGESNGFVWAPLYVWLVIYLRPQNDVFIFFHQISLAKYLSGRNIGIKFQLGKGCPRNGGGLTCTFVTEMRKYQVVAVGFTRCGLVRKRQWSWLNGWTPNAAPLTLALWLKQEELLMHL